MENSFKYYAEKLAAFADVSRDGYAIFTAEDKLLCANRAFMDVFFVDEAKLIGQYFSDIMRSAFHTSKGPRIDADNIEAWLSRVQQLRRSRDFRLFEVDLIDGRWFLFSEQTLPDGEMLLQTKDITKQKIVEQHLNEHTRKLTDLALTDELTQIANRRRIMMQAEQERVKALDTSKNAIRSLFLVMVFSKDKALIVSSHECSVYVCQLQVRQ